MLRAVFAPLLTLAAIGLSSSAFADAEFILKIATQAPEGTPWAELMNRYKKAVQTASNGRIEVRVYLGGKSGDENGTVAKTSKGTLQGVAASTGAIASVVPELAPLELPFLFKGFGEADYILDEVLTKPMEKYFSDRGLVLGFWSENGFRHFGSSFGEIHKASDIAGKKMRSQENPVHLAMWKVFKASSQAIPTTEVLTALQTGAVEGFDQTLLFALAAKWHRSIKFLTLSGHIYQPAAVAFNKAWFDTLPADLQKVLIDEGRKLQATGRKLIRSMNGDLVKLIEKEGVKVVKLTDGERKAFEEAAMPVREAFMSSQTAATKATLAMIDEGLKKFRK